jgi:hypothetical protein
MVAGALPAVVLLLELRFLAAAAGADHAVGPARWLPEGFAGLC